MIGRHNSGQKGFTVVELMIATSTFSVILLVCLSAILYIGRMYYKGVSTAQTQEIARSVVDEIASAAQFSADDLRILPADSGWDGAYCISGRKYSYKLDTQLISDSPGRNQSQEVLVVSDDPGCSLASSPVPIDSNKRELLLEQMRLTQFDISTADGLVNLVLGIALGGDSSDPTVDAEIFEVEPDGSLSFCKTGAAGSQFCATANLQTSIFRKVY